MSKTSTKRYIARDGLKDATHVEVGVFYDKGGTNMFTGSNDSRGYYLRVAPVTVKDNTVSFVMFSGFKVKLVAAPRFNANHFATYGSKVDAVAEGIADAFVADDKPKVADLAREAVK